jgi:hypothetical protein
MGKTVLTEFIEYLEGIKERDDIPSHVVTTAKNYLQHEKQQILKCVDDAQKTNFWVKFESNEDYFTKTFTDELP